MVNKILGYLLALVGIIAIASTSFPQIEKLIKIPESIPELYITIGGVLVLIGLILIAKLGGSKKSAELPIFQGKQIVGYRRH